MVDIRRRGVTLLASAVVAAALTAAVAVPSSGVSAPALPTADATTTATATPVATPEGWSLVWADEFEGTEVDRTRWTVLDRSTYGDGNKELACLMDRPENVRVADGTLHLTAQREQVPLVCGRNDQRFPEGRAYSSAHLHTRYKAGFTYGRIEMRAVLPTAPGTSKGLWPALWLRPTEGGTGELDVMEALGSDGSDDEWRVVHQTIHYDYVRTHPKQGNAFRFPDGVTPSDGMHVYAVEWEADAIRWYVDDQLVYTRDATTTSWLSPTFDKEFFIRLNLAVGGGWPGAPTDATQFPATYAVDYVRVYQR